MGAVKIVTVKNKIPLFRGLEQANAIELIEFEEVGNQVVAGLGDYEVGGKAVFVEPDYNLPDIEMFKPFYYPGGDASKSKLGSNGRIKAIKFNFHTGDYVKIISYGIVLPLSVLSDFKYSDIADLDELLGITKHVPINDSGRNDINKIDNPVPDDLYKIDEENINNIWNYIKYPITLIGTQKVDGASITLFAKYSDGTKGICSRNLIRPLQIFKKVGDKKLNIIDKIYLAIKKLCVGVKPEDYEVFDCVDNTADEFVRIGKPYLDKIVEFAKNKKLDLALRGELHGKGLGGYGNNSNPNRNDNPNIKFFSVDLFDTKQLRFKRTGESYFDQVISDLNFERCPKYFEQEFNSKEEIIAKCQEVFKHEKILNGRLIEGIVLRDVNHQFSTKLMNLEYDLKK